MRGPDRFSMRGITLSHSRCAEPGVLFELKAQLAHAQKLAESHAEDRDRMAKKAELAKAEHRKAEERCAAVLEENAKLEKSLTEAQRSAEEAKRQVAAAEQLEALQKKIKGEL